MLFRAYVLSMALAIGGSFHAGCGGGAGSPPPDAGAPAPDGAPAESPQPDGGPADAAPPDGGPADAAPPDGGPADAAPPDAEPQNRAPTALDDVVYMQWDTLAVIDVVANDSDPDGDTVSIETVAVPGHGTAVHNDDGTISYMPVSQFSGMDEFTYEIIDPWGAVDSATVTIHVNGEPSAVDDDVVSETGETIVVHVLANDVDPDDDTMFVTGVGTPANGTAVSNGDGTISYTSNVDFLGSDSLTYSISDGRGGVDQATIHVSVVNTGSVLLVTTTAGGQVASTFNELTCRGTCEEVYAEQATITLTLSAISDAGFEFLGWSGDCSGTGTCTVSMSATSPDVNVTAEFAPTGLSYDICPTQHTGPTGGGTTTLEAIADIVVLCDGWMLYAEVTNNRLLLRNVIDETVAQVFQLSSVPREIALDPTHGLVYVAYTNTQTLARIDLNTGELRHLWIGDTTQSLAVSDDGIVFLRSGTNSTVTTLDGTTVEPLGTHPVMGSDIDYNDATDRLITSFSNYFYDRMTDTLTLQGASAGGGSGANCARVYVSPDGNHAAKPCGAGNGPGYSIYDFYSHNPSIVQGEWQTGAYPRGAWFSPNSRYALLTNGTHLQLFSVETHALLASYIGSTCNYYSLRKLGVSLDSRYLIGITTCGFSGNYTVVTWRYHDTSM